MALKRLVREVAVDDVRAVSAQAWGARVAQGQHVVVVARPRAWRA
jgi:hypothetical protein